MASTVLSQSLFSVQSSSISKRSVSGASPCSLRFNQPSAVPKSGIISTPLRKIRHCSVVCSTSTDDSSSPADTPIELKYPAYPTVMDINQIREILPHRFPFLLVDRVIEYSPGVSAVAIKNVTINDNFFPGHFPERPIMPGVLMVENKLCEPGMLIVSDFIELIRNSEMWITVAFSQMPLKCIPDAMEAAMAQVGGIVMLQPEVGGSRENFFFAGVDKVRFRKPVIAGDTLVMRMNLVKLQKRFGIAKMEGKAYVGGEVVCEGEFLMAMG